MKRVCHRCKKLFDYSPRLFGVRVGVARYICSDCAIKACEKVISRHKERIGNVLHS
ncbi:hypothetical protein [Methanosarcina siciliae]|uniref:hypothetical protein n=1 Tax=Methanosarcina siciliae TaxID=38027 RepID=UPI000AD7E7D3|nr:hypothetical protein [Methanosarcina siciliae]